MTAHRGSPSGRRSRLAAPVCALLALVLVLALSACAAPIRGSGRLASPSGTPSPTPTEIQASRSCPSIVDPVARLSYQCIDDSLERTFGSSYDLTFDPDGTMMTKTTEPGWVAVQQSGTLRVDGPTAKAVALEAGAQQAENNYGENPSASTVLEEEIEGKGVEAYRWDQLITLDPDYMKDRGLLATSEMLSTVVIKLEDGRYVAMSLSIPDTEKDWWPRFDEIISSLSVV